MITEIRIYADGRTDPHIESGTAIILIQEERVNAGRFVLAKDEYFDFHIGYPINHSYIYSLAITYINSLKGKLSSEADAKIILCPLGIATQMEW